MINIQQKAKQALGRHLDSRNKYLVSTLQATVPTCTRIHRSPLTTLLTADNTGRMGLRKTQVMKNKDVVVGEGEEVETAGATTGRELFAQTDNFYCFLQSFLCPPPDMFPCIFLSFSTHNSPPIVPQFIFLHLADAPLKSSRKQS